MAAKNLDLAQVGFDFGNVPNVPVAPTPTPPRADDPDDPPEPRFALALRLARMIAAGERFNGQRLMDEAAAVFGSTLAAGRWSSKEAYDALEVAVNRHLLDTETAHWTALAAEGAAAKARALTQFVQRLPTQTRRDEETDEYQQFSTPPALAFVANWVAHVRPEDTLLEPSAGTADLAIWSRIAGAQVILNELSPRRLALLAQLLPDAPRFAENAEHLDNVLPPDLLPTVIVMNPPFSATAGRIPGERKTTNGARHIEQALRRLADNGRLVAIVGDGMAPERPMFYAWWREIERHYSVRANVGIAGREYAKYGTTFDHRLLVIDKCGPTQATVVTGRVASVAELPPSWRTFEMPVQDYQQHPLNQQAAQILRRYDIPFHPATELASLALIRVALERGLLETRTIPEPLRLIAHLSRHPDQAMAWLTQAEPATDPAMTFEIELPPSLAEAAATLLEEIVASQRAATPTPSPSSSRR